MSKASFDSTMLRMPPLKSELTKERYDSVQNMNQSVTVIYKNAKSYPAFLIKYEL